MKNSLPRIVGMLFCLLGMHVFSYAQTGTLRGKVTDGETGDALLGATVQMLQDGTLKGGAYTDLEGTYTISAAPGNYTLMISYLSYITDTLEVVATDGEVTFNETTMFLTMEVREDLKVEIVAKANQASDVTLFSKKLNSINTIDGVSADLAARVGAPTAAAAMTRVTGVTVEGGRYVYVRGLGDRYSLTTLNGAEIPGLDPDRNSVQMDIFPSNLLDNIIVYKNFTPDLPGSFSGGLVNVITKDFPERFTLNISGTVGFNTQASNEDQFLSYQTGDTDWLGYDDGTRQIPDFINNLPGGTIPNKNVPNLSITDAQTIADASQEFNGSMFPITDKSGLNYNFQASVGNQFNIGRGNRPLGFIATLSYRSTYDHFVDGIERRYKNTDSTATTLNNELNLASDVSSRNVLWGGLVKVSFKPKTNHKLGFNYMLNRSGESRTNDLFGSIPEQNIDNYETRVLGYTERQLDIYQLQGEHVFGQKNADGAIEKPILEVDWIASLSTSRQDEPDLRFFSNEFIFNQEGIPIYDLDISVYREPSRFFRELSEDNLDLKLNFKLPLAISERKGSFKFGGAYTQKDRDFIERRFTLDTDLRRAPYEGDPAAWFTNENIGIDEIDTLSNGRIIARFNGVYQETTVQSNSYVGEQDILGTYAMFDLPLTDKLKFIGGARLEITDATVKSGNPRDSVGVLDLEDVLPSANFIYALQEKMNLRAGYSRTLARPNFREFAPLRTFPFERGNETAGNPDLERTLIDNLDLRWEWYPRAKEIVSVSLFYKSFDNPIEKVIIPEEQNLAFRFDNVPSGTAYGAEFEVRKSLDFLGETFTNFEVGGNISFIESEVDINETELRLIRTVDPGRPSTRPIFGQSPYVANAELLYNDPLKGSQVSVSYNIFGERIVLVGGQSAPDVYEQPRGLLNVSITQRFGPLQIRLRGTNLLDPDFEMIQTHEFFNRDSNGNRTGGKQEREYVFQRFTRGRTFSLGLSYNFN